MVPLVEAANASHTHFAKSICTAYRESAKRRGTGIAQRNEDFIIAKMKAGDAIIATVDGTWAGFTYINTYDDADYVAHSGLIVLPKFRGLGLSKQLKHRIFVLTEEKYPDAAIFGITTSAAVMKMNTELGYKPVTYAELPASESFWDGCKSCPNYKILQEKNRKMCMCTALLYLPREAKKTPPKPAPTDVAKLAALERLYREKRTEQVEQVADYIALAN